MEEAASGLLPEEENGKSQDTGSMDTSKTMGISVSLQTNTSWLHEHTFEKNTTESITPPVIDLPASDQEEDLYSSLSEDLSELSILWDMEFSSEYMTYFEDHLKTLPSVGPPTIMAYKRESSEMDRHLAMMKIVQEESGKEICEFCGNPLKPFPLEYSADMDFTDELFCCRKCKHTFELFFKEKKRLFKRDTIEMIPIAPHGPHGSESDRQKAKEKTAQRLQQRQLAKFHASMEMEPTTVTEYAKPLKTISYQLSNAPPDMDNWTAKGKYAASEMKDGLFDDEYIYCDFTLISEKIPVQFVEKYYRTGRKFLSLFPDGTAQIFYPSGNLAIIVIVNKPKGSICIVQEDQSNNAVIQAVFESSGNATCYHQNGVVWININTEGGQYSDHIGRRVRRWKWKSSVPAEPCVQFKPIFISLSHQVGVRIIGQDQMFVSFLAMGKQAKFNVGKRGQKLRQVMAMESGMQLNKEVAEDELMLFAIKIKILSLVNKLHEYLNFPSNKQWDKIKPPTFLIAQAQKVINLCSVCSINKEVNSSILAILENNLDGNNSN
ncbi:glutamate-rich protein 6 [Pelodytes ibericus]